MHSVLSGPEINRQTGSVQSLPLNNLQDYPFTLKTVSGRRRLPVDKTSLMQAMCCPHR